MKKIIFPWILVALFVPLCAVSTAADDKDFIMQAKGSFEVNLAPQEDEIAPAGRMVIEKAYSGDLVATGKGQMLSKRTPSGSAVYTAIEEVEGKIADLSGSFTLMHMGKMSSEGQSLEINIVSGSGSGDFEGITGSLEIIQSDGKHDYILTYSL